MKIRADKFIRYELAVITLAFGIASIVCLVLCAMKWETCSWLVGSSVGILISGINWLFYGREILLTDRGCSIRFGRIKKDYLWRELRIVTVPYSNFHQMQLSYNCCYMVCRNDLSKRKMKFASKHPLLYCFLNPFSSCPIHYRPKNKADRTSQIVFTKAGYGAIYEVEAKCFETFTVNNQLLIE